ncbi:hypothetical protein M2336_002789 [Sphingobium sp. B1D7B]|uniref:DUF5677 domain-containing protein n=1 Tax=Sphingobium sp. B1D7B TaxID=2940578 RepID=UPI002225B4A9|nr:DUF5677 domain-containing protein [Sphingobium sp. B1D7B]MCW2406160.1 hypothetical protein [Sphingobium sp. B1D7B]
MLFTSSWNWSHQRAPIYDRIRDFRSADVAAMSQNSSSSDILPGAMDDMHREFVRAFREIRDAGYSVSEVSLTRAIEKSSRSAGRLMYRTLMETAPNMLKERRAHIAAFEVGNFRRWRKAFDLIETIWVSCEELGRNINDHYRPIAASEQDFLFEAIVHLHAKSLLVGAEIIALLKAGFPDGALARWRTLYEANVIASLLRQHGAGLALRYLAHERVQAWNLAKDNPHDNEEWRTLKAQAEHAIQEYGSEIQRMNGWACEITRSKQPTFAQIAAQAAAGEDRSMYRYASAHIHANHRAISELLGMSEAQGPVLLVGPSNSGMVDPLILTSFSLVEVTTYLLLLKPNVDSLALADTLLRMAKRMDRLVRSIERRSFEAAQKRRSRSNVPKVDTP